MNQAGINYNLTSSVFTVTFLTVRKSLFAASQTHQKQFGSYTIGFPGPWEGDLTSELLISERTCLLH